MKKTNLLNLMLIASICTVTTSLNCAMVEEYLPEAQWRHHALDIYRLWGQKESVYQAKQTAKKRLMPTCPVKIINNDDAINLKISARDAQFGDKTGSTKVYIKPLRMSLDSARISRTKAQPVEQEQLMPIIPLSVTVDDIDKKEIQKKLKNKIHLGSFELSPDEIRCIKSIKICNYGAVIEYADGSKRIVKFCRL